MNKKLPLHDFHSENGANFIEQKNWLIPKDYGNVNTELYQVKTAATLLDRSYLGKIKITGADTIDFLNRISTNDITKLVLGTVCDTVFATPKGRIVDYCRAIRLDNSYLIISSYVDCTHLIEWLSRFHILEDIEITDASREFHWLTLIGPRATEFVKSISGHEFQPNDEHIWINYNGMDFAAFLNKNFIYPAYNLCIPADYEYTLVSWLQEKLVEIEGGLIGDTAFQITRVESGMPDWGTELTEDYNPHEARLLNAVSFTKGCYTGQEIIARLDAYDKVQKYLMIIDMDEVISARPPLDIYLEDEQIGTLTSYAFDPLANRSVGLGYVKKMYAMEEFLLSVDVIVGNSRIRAQLRTPPVQ
jgi:folate-binding protein YgfZ